MNASRRTAIVVGVLFLAAIATYGLGITLAGSILDVPNSLENVSDNSNRMVVAVLLEFINGVAVIGIGVLMLPILRQFNTNIAFGYLSTGFSPSWLGVTTFVVDMVCNTWRRAVRKTVLCAYGKSTLHPITGMSPSGILRADTSHTAGRI